MMDVNISECCRTVDEMVKLMRPIGRPNVLTDNKGHDPMWLPLYHGLLTKKALECRGLGRHGRLRLIRKCAANLGIEVEHRLYDYLAEVATSVALKVGCSNENAILALIKADALMPRGTRIALMGRYNDHRFVVVEDARREKWVIDPWTEGQSGKPYGVGLYCFDGIKNRHFHLHSASGDDRLERLLERYCQREEFKHALVWAEKQLRLTIQDIAQDPQTYANRLGVTLYAKPL